MDWRTMETAPHTETVLLWFPWRGQPNALAPKGFAYTGRWLDYDDRPDGTWVDSDGDAIGPDPSYWCPIEPPQS